MAVPSTPLFGNPTRVTADVAIKASAGKLWGVMIEGGTESDGTSIDFYNHAESATGSIVFGVSAPVVGKGQSTVIINLIPFGGIDFSTGIWADWQGTGCVAYVWFS